MKKVAYRFDTSVENDKRRQALTPFLPFDAGSRSFFDRVLSVRKFREPVFVTDAKDKSR